MTGARTSEGSGSMIAAIPYATISVIDRKNEEASNRIEMTALAPIAPAFAAMRPIARWREPSSRPVYSRISLPNDERIPATKFVRTLARTTIE
jgi:hypothetical protein